MKHAFEDLSPVFRQIEGEQGTLLASALFSCLQLKIILLPNGTFWGVIFCCSLGSTVKSWGQTHRSFEDYSKCTICNTIPSRSSIPVNLHFPSLLLIAYKMIKS